MKITLTTIKSFIKKNQGKLYISNLRSFDGMVDGEKECSDKSFRPAETDTHHPTNSLGIKGAWFVFGSRDSFQAIEEEGYTGFRVYNCCGSFKLAVKKGGETCTTPR